MFFFYQFCIIAVQPSFFENSHNHYETHAPTFILLYYTCDYRSWTSRSQTLSVRSLTFTFKLGYAQGQVCFWMCLCAFHSAFVRFTYIAMKVSFSRSWVMKELVWILKTITKVVLRAQWSLICNTTVSRTIRKNCLGTIQRCERLHWKMTV